MLAGSRGKRIRDDVDAAVFRHVPRPPPADPDAPGPFSFANPNRAEAILSRAGFSGISIDRLDEKVGGSTVDQTTDMLLEVGPARAFIKDVGQETLTAIKAEIRAALTPMAKPDGVFLTAAGWLVTARCA